MENLNYSKNFEDAFAVLYETGKIINSSLDIDTIIKNIVNIVSVRLGFEEFSFLAVEGNALVLKGARNHPKWGDKNYHIPLGKGITGTVAVTGEPLLINDVRKDARYMAVRPGFLSELCVPIKVDGKVVGVFNLENRNINAFDENDLRLLNAIADQASVALKNASLHKSYSDNMKRLSNLYESGKAINTSLHLDNVLKALLEISAKELKYNSIAILLLKKGKLYAKAGLGFSDGELSTYTAEIGEGICGRVAETGESIIANDVSKNPHYIIQSPKTKSEMAVPIKYGRTVIGVYNVESNELDSFDEDDLLFISALAEQAAIAIKNAELYEEIESFSELLKKRVEEATDELKGANKELQRLNRIKTDFVSTVSHELRTPMTSIVGYIDVVRDGECGEINSQQREFLQIAHEESMRLYRLISDLLDIQKIEAKKMIYLLREFDIGSFFRKYAKEAEVQCKSKGLNFSMALPGQIPVIKADADKFRQIMTNLVSNAVKFTKEGGIKVEVQVFPDAVQISVSDTGIGISEENREKVFEKFSQLNMEA
ncbi:GAF domain-containing protein, partial [Candidatus Woesearchaeota archaeon]|nr:GAF domain-containing protein [Candidatus Woesearchaeota archaeon]